MGVDPGAGDRGESRGQLRGEVVSSGVRGEGVQQERPRGVGGGVGGAEAVLEAALPQGRGLGELLGSGGTVVAVGNGVRGAPYGEVAEQLRGGPGLPTRTPGWGGLVG